MTLYKVLLLSGQKIPNSVERWFLHNYYEHTPRINLEVKQRVEGTLWTNLYVVEWLASFRRGLVWRTQLSVTNIVQEIEIDKCVMSQAWKLYELTNTDVIMVYGGVPRKATPMNGWYNIIQVKEIDISQHTALRSRCVRQRDKIPLFILGRWFHNGILFAHSSECYTVGTRYRWWYSLNCCKIQSFSIASNSQRQLM